MNYDMMSGSGFMHGWGGMMFGGFMMIFWVALLVVLIVLLVRWLGGSPGKRSGSDAMDTLKQRFARGEIDASEFEERARQLRAMQ